MSLDRQAWNRVLARIARFRSEIRSHPVACASEPAALRKDVQRRFPFTAPMSLGEAADTLMDLYDAHLVHVTHPRMFGLFNPSVREAAMLGDTIVAAYNPQLAVWTHAAAAAEVERHVLHTLAAVLGYASPSLAAHFTSGGMEANHTAVLAAIAVRFAEHADGGLARVAATGGRPALYVSRESHHSFVKIARMTGLGTDAVRVVATTDALAMDPVALRARIADDRAAGWTPFFVVATVGTTACGACDDLVTIGGVARDEGLWLHVDAAWAGAAAFAPGLRHLFDGIAEADSVTWDAHKWLSVPMGAGMFFTRHPAAPERAFAVRASYMPVDGREPLTRDGFDTSAQWSRRSIGGKVALALAELGVDGYRRLVEQMVQMGNLLRRSLAEDGWIIVNRTALPLVAFTSAAIRSGAVDCQAFTRQIQESGAVWISDVVLPSGERVLRACITSFNTGAEDVAALTRELRERHSSWACPPGGSPRAMAR